MICPCEELIRSRLIIHKLLRGEVLNVLLHGGQGIEKPLHHGRLLVDNILIASLESNRTILVKHIANCLMVYNAFRQNKMYLLLVE